MKRSVIIAAAIIVTATGAYLARDQIHHLIDPTNGALAACEENLKTQLKSPSSYKRIDYKFFEYPSGMTIDGFKQFQKTHFTTADPVLGEARGLSQGYIDQLAMEMSLRKPLSKITDHDRQKWLDDKLKRDFNLFQAVRNNTRTASVFVTYEAENSYGASLKNIHECNFAPPKSDIGSYSADDLYDIDG